MATLDLRAKYGGSSRQSIARAIRAEIPAGEEIIDAERHAHGRISRANGDKYEAAARMWQRARAARVEAENEIRERYGMPPRRDAVALPPKS